MLTAVRLTGQPSWSQDLRLVIGPVQIHRRGLLHVLLLRGVEGHVESVQTIAAETTTQVLLNRRLALLATLNEQFVGLDDPDELAEGQVVGRAVSTASRHAVRRRVVRVTPGSAAALIWARPSRS